MVLTFNVTRRKLVLGTRDDTTGWYDVSYTESTIEMPVEDRGANALPLPAGTYVRLDALGMTADVVLEGDQIKTDDGRYYEVKTVREVWLADSFIRRDCDLTRLPLHELI